MVHSQSQLQKQDRMSRFSIPMNRSMLMADDDIAIMMLKLDYQQSSQYGPDPLPPPPVDPAILLAPCLTPCNAA